MARCVCDSIYSGPRCEQASYTHCHHGGSLTRDKETGEARCVCPEGFQGFRCELQSEGASLHHIDNTAINSLTITIVAVSTVSVALVGVVVYLVYFTTHRRSLSSPFRHRRLDDGGGDNMEFSNRVFLQDEETEVTREAGPSRNFVNPVYETMFQESEAPIIRPGAHVQEAPIIRPGAHVQEAPIIRPGAHVQEAPIIRPGAHVPGITPSEVTLLGPDAMAGADLGHVITLDQSETRAVDSEPIRGQDLGDVISIDQSEHSGLLRGQDTPPQGRAVIHTDSD